MNNNGHEMSANIAASKNPLWTDEELEDEATWSIETSTSSLEGFLEPELHSSSCSCDLCDPNGTYHDDSDDPMDGTYWTDVVTSLVDKSPSQPEDNNELECPPAPRKTTLPPREKTFHYRPGGMCFNVWTNKWESPSPYKQPRSARQETILLEEPEGTLHEQAIRLGYHLPTAAEKAKREREELHGQECFCCDCVKPNKKRRFR